VVTDSDLDVDGVNDAKTVNMTVSWERLAQPGASARSISIDFIKPDA
jgi:hypothetical protein